jgi:hypothetical protein
MRLRNRPKRASRYATYMRRVIAGGKFLLHWLPDKKDELEGYSILAVILCYHLDIVLDSAM